MRELSDSEVFGNPKELTDDDVFRTAPKRLNAPGMAIDGQMIPGRDMRQFDFKAILNRKPEPAPLRGSPGAVWSAAPPAGHWTDNVRDPAASVLKIGPTALKGVADIARLLTGDGVGAGVSGAMRTGMDSIDDVVGSDRLRAQKAAISAALENPEVSLSDFPGMVAQNPVAAMDAGISTVGSMFLPAGVAAGAIRAAPSVARVAPAISRAAPGTIATNAAIGTGAFQNAAETFADTQGHPLLDRYQGAGISAAASLVLGKLFGGGAEGEIARRIAGQGGYSGAPALLKTVAKAGGKEFGQEFGEEGANYIGKQVAKGEDIDPLTGGKHALYGGMLGLGVGGASGVGTSIGSQAQPQNRGASPQVAPGFDQPAPQTTPPIEPAALQTAAPEAPDADPVRSLAKLIADTAIQPSPLAPKQAAAPQAELTDQDVFGDIAPSGADLLRDATKMVPEAAELAPAAEMQQEIDAQLPAEIAPQDPAVFAPQLPAETAAQTTAETAGITEPDTEPRLPKELAGAKPRYAYGGKQFDLTFESDIDRAAYIAAQATPSERDADYVAFAVKATGQPAAEIRKHGAKVRAAIKSMAKDATPGMLTIPPQYKAPAAVDVKARRSVPKASNTLLQAIINRGGISRSIMQDVGGDPGGRYAPGLFTKNGTTDLSELAELLADEDGFAIDLASDIGGARELEDMVARMLGGERITNAATMEAERNKAEEGQYRNEIRAKAKELGVRTVARKFADVEAEVLAAEEARHQASLDDMTGQERMAYDALLEEARSLGIDVEQVVDSIPSNYTFRQAVEATTAKLVPMIEQRLAELNGELQQATDEREPDEQSYRAAEEADAREQEQGAGAGGEQAGAGRNAAQGSSTQAAEFDLAGQSNEEIAAAERAAKEAEAQRQADERAAEQRRQADAERDSFTLTGSDRAADVAASQGQGGLFDAPVSQPKTESRAEPQQDKAPVSQQDTRPTLDADGRRTDGKPIKAGDVFRTLTGRETTPFPKQKSEKYASQWLIDNATAEADARGDSFNSGVFKATPIMRNGELTTADRESLTAYLFDQQPDVVPPITRPLSGDERFSKKEPERNLSEQNPANRTTQNDSAAFRRWSNDAPFISGEEAGSHQFKTGEKVVVEAYHGTGRPDRVGTVFQKKRATSGPMAFFTSNPELASGYAKGKQDTSLAYEDGHYANWFKYKPKGMRTPVDIVRAWYSLDAETKNKIREIAPTLRLSDDAESVVIEEGGTNGNGSYDYQLEQSARRNRFGGGNPLEALVEDWLNSGTLFDNEELFMQVLAKAGFPVRDVSFDSPNASYPFVYKAFIQMQSPLVTSDIPQEVMDALAEAAKKDRSRPQAGGADMWDKNTRTIREWYATLTDPNNTNAAYVWTSIPDKVTNVFKSLGYDGIIDWSGKGGGNIVAPVYIPFDETQVKSAIGNNGKYDPAKRDILKSQGTGAGMPAADVEAGIKRMLGDDVGQALLDTGIISIDATLPADVQGATYRDGRIVLNPKALDADTLAGVVKHEGFHSTIKELVGQATYDKLMARLQSMLDSGVQWAQDARDAVPSDTKPEHVLEEVGAYAIEQYANGEKQPAGVRRWVEALLSAIRTALIRYAKGRVQAAAIERMQPQDLARLAVAGLKAKAAGMESARTAEAYSRSAQTNTPAFRRWFGDSKVVDADGKPLVVYHGTAADFSEFDPSRLGEKTGGADARGGFFFAANPDSADQFTWAEGAKSGSIMPVYLSISNPAKGTTRLDGSNGRAAAREIEAAKAAGHDGIVFDSDMLGHKGDTWVAFRPEQIKSAIGNNGDFDPANPDIRYSKPTPSNDRRRPAGDGDPQSELGLPKAPTPRPEMPSLRDAFRFDRTPAGRRENVAGRKIYDRLASYATSYLGTETLGKFALADDRPEAFKTMMRRWRVDQQKAAGTAKKIAEEGKKLTIAQRKAISALIEKQVAVGDVPPQEIVDLAANITASLEIQARELVELGMLSEDRLVENYLPRLYQNPTVAALENGDMLRTTLRKAMMRMRGERLRQRGMTAEFKANQVEAAKKLGWKIDRDGLAPEQLEAIEQGRTDMKIPMWRDYTKKEREAMGEIDDAILRYAVGYMETQKDVAIGRLFQSIASNADLAKNYNPGGWTRVPQTSVKGAEGLKAYGKLAGMWVHPSVALSLEQYTQPKGSVMAAHDKLLSMWKEGKVVWNTVSHGNNIASNVHTAVFAGLNVTNPKLWQDTLREYKGKGEYFNEAVEAGLFGNDIVSSEIIDMLTPDLSSMKSVEAVITSRLGKLIKMAQTVGKPVGWYRKTAQKLYEGEDQIFKLMAFMEARKAGATPEQAVAYAERYFFNYNDMPPGIEGIKRTAIPFVSYAYRATPMLLHTALTRPDLMLLPAALYYGANMLGYALSGGDEEEERKAMPDYMKGWSAATLTPKAIRMPFNWNDRPVFYDISRRVPMGDLFDLNNQMGGLDVPAPFMPSHPLISTYTGIFANKDNFTGKDLTKNSDTAEEKFKARVGYTLRQVLPNALFVPGSYSNNQLLDGIASATDTDINLWFAEYTGANKSGDPVNPISAALNIIGVAKVRSFDPVKERDYKSSDFNRDTREIMANKRSIRRDQSIGEARRESRIAEQERKLDQLRERRNKELN